MITKVLTKFMCLLINSLCLGTLNSNYFMNIIPAVSEAIATFVMALYMAAVR